MSKLPKRLGELLVERGIITSRQLEEALEVQRASGDFLGAILVRKGWMTELQLLNALSEQFEIPVIQLGGEDLDWTVAEQFPLSLLVGHTCFPFRQDGESVTVAISNPLDAWAESELEKEVGGREIRLVLASGKEIEAAIRTFCQKRMNGTLGGKEE